METTAIITAAGKNARWGSYLNKGKHLAPVDAPGQTIIGRTVAMLKNSGIDNIFVATQNDKIIDSVAKDSGIIRPANSESLADTILSSRKKWTGRTIVLLRDVFFTHQCFGTILARFRDCGGLRFSYLKMPLARKLDCLKVDCILPQQA